MENVFVTLKRSDTKEAFDLSLPIDLSAGTLIRLLCESLEWNHDADCPVDERQLYFIVEQTGQKICADENLNNARVLTGDCLQVDLGMRGRVSGDIPYFSSPSAGFATADNRFFEIQYNRSLLGRSDPTQGLFPQEFVVDLNGIDHRPISSRRHAQIKRSGGVYTIQDLKSKHGTLVNSRKLEDGERVEIKDGDIIELGEGGVRLRFQAGKKD